MSNLTFQSTVTLRDGNTMPILGYSATEHSYSYVTQTEIFLDAIELGYRYFDLSYDDDCLIPLRRAIERSGIDREEFFVSCRFGDAQNRGTPGAGTANELFEQFGGPIDLVSLPWPYYASMNNAWSGPIGYTKLANGYPSGMQNFYPDVMPEIGVCNFDIKHFESLKEYEAFRFLPFVNQNQFHPLYTCKELRQYCKDNGIVFVKNFEKNDVVEVKKPTYATDVTKNGEYFIVSERERKANELNLQMYTNAIHKLLIKQGSPQGEAMEKDLFDFELTKGEMNCIDSFNMDKRFGYHPDYQDF